LNAQKLQCSHNRQFCIRITHGDTYYAPCSCNGITLIRLVVLWSMKSTIS